MSGSRCQAGFYGFVADMTGAKSDFNIDRSEDPLSHLAEVIAFTRNRFTSRKVAAGVTSIPP